MCEQFKAENVVCPSNLRKGLFTVAALDNLDHNPTSTTSQGSFHGTGISIIQHPTLENVGLHRNLKTKFISKTSSHKPTLPDSYAVVPAVCIKPSATSIPAAITTETSGALTPALAQEDQWIQHSIRLLHEDNLSKGHALSWAAYHASTQPLQTHVPAITALLPLFSEKADSPAMVKHGMNIVRGSTELLNPGQ